MISEDIKNKAESLRSNGFSYNQISSELNISKATLSSWFKDKPLSTEQMKLVRDYNPTRIEKFKNTMQYKKDIRLDEAYQIVKKDIGVFTKRDLYIAGLFLYFGEGSKTTVSTTALTNTNPHMIRFFIDWLLSLGVKKDRLRVKLHLYSDMNIEKQITFWSKELSIPETQFRKSYIKTNTTENVTYKGYFGQGTCTVIYENSLFCNYVLMGLRRIQEIK